MCFFKLCTEISHSLSLPHSTAVSLTQWSLKFRVTSAGPRERAGFMLAPVKGICDVREIKSVVCISV